MSPSNNPSGFFAGAAHTNASHGIFIDVGGLIINHAPEISSSGPIAPSMSEELKKSGKFGYTGEDVISFDDPNEIRNLPGSPGIVRIQEIEIEHGEIVYSLRVTYLLTDNKIYTTWWRGVTPMYLPTVKTSVHLQDDEVIEAIEGYHMTWPSVWAVVRSMSFIFRRSDGALRTIGPFGTSLLGTKFSVPGRIIAFAGCYKRRYLKFMGYETLVALSFFYKPALPVLRN